MTLSPDQAQSTVLAVLGGIAPEADLVGLDPRANLRRTLDLDSVDFQNFLIGLAKATGTDIPDRVAPSLVTVEACVRHVAGDRRQEEKGTVPDCRSPREEKGTVPDCRSPREEKGTVPDCRSP